MIDHDPAELVPVNPKQKSVDDRDKDGSESRRSPIPRKAQVRKKRLHWSGLDASQLGHDSVWFESDDEDLEIDKEEFDRLFAEQKKPDNSDLTQSKMKEDGHNGDKESDS